MLQTPGAAANQRLEPEVISPSTNSYVRAADAQGPKTRRNDPFPREIRKVSATESAGLLSGLAAHKEPRAPPGEAPATIPLHPHAGAGDSPCSAWKKTVTLPRSNCFLATELEADDGRRGEFLANSHLSKLCIWPRTLFVSFPTQLRAHTHRSADTRQETFPDSLTGRRNVTFVKLQQL